MRSVEVRDVDSGGILARLPHPRRVCGLAWSGDGTTLAAGCDDHQIHLWDVATYRLRTVLKGHDGPVVFVAFHPAADLLVSASWDGTSRLWDPATGKQLVRGRAVPSASAPTERALSYSDAPRVGVWEVARGDACRLLHPLDPKPAPRGRRVRALWRSRLKPPSFSDVVVLSVCDHRGWGLRIRWSGSLGEVAQVVTIDCSRAGQFPLESLKTHSPTRS